jgi:hypothetical protein
MAKTYAEKLKDPRWDKVRKRILRRDNHTCSNCGDCELTLDVHHGYYGKNMEPWEYPDHTLHTLCRDCHGSAEEIRNQVYAELAQWKPEALKSLLFYLYNARDLKDSIDRQKAAEQIKILKEQPINTTEFGEEVNNV